MRILCSDCFALFEYTDNEQAFFESRGWKKPIRCPICRQKNKQKHSDPYFGWESSMGYGGSLRHRHTRVHYAPHVVGGFR